MRPRLPSVALLLIAVTAALAGCAQQRKATVGSSAPATRGPDYGRPLPPGRSALRRITDPSRLPDIGAARRNHDALLLDAIDSSLLWFEAPSSRRAFPFEGVTHRQAQASLVAIADLLERSPDEATFIDGMRRMFDVYESVGYDGEGVVLFTGYYAPILRASRTRAPGFEHPLYRRPDDLLTDPATGEPLGRRGAGGGRSPYPTRREIETTSMLAGTELVWLEDALSAYLVHVNGSAKLRLEGGGVIYVGYAGKTDRPYASLGQAMIDAGLLGADGVSLPAIRRVHQRRPREVEALMHRNENFVFFSEYDGERWPAGSLGVKVTSECSVATDKAIYPRGGLVLVDTSAVTFSDGRRAFLRFMLDQDTGGAIKAPGRADLFMGIGPGAEILAGGQHAEGRMYYFFLKPAYVARFDGGAAVHAGR